MIFYHLYKLSLTADNTHICFFHNNTISTHVCLQTTKYMHKFRGEGKNTMSLLIKRARELAPNTQVCHPHTLEIIAVNPNVLKIFAG